MSHPFRPERLGEILRSDGVVIDVGIGTTLEGNGQRIGERLVNAGMVSQSQVAQALAYQFGLPFVDLSGFAVPHDMFVHLPAVQAYRLAAVPYKFEAGLLTVVVGDPGSLFLIENLERISGTRIELAVGCPAEIAAALKRSQGAAEVLRNVSLPFQQTSPKMKDYAPKESLAFTTQSAGESTVVNLVNTMLLAAMQQRASDIHVETEESGIAVKYRIDGVLYAAMDRIDRQHHGEIVSRLKVMSGLDIAEQRTPQDGRFNLDLNGRDVDFRVSVLPGVYGEDVVVRILDKSAITEDFALLSIETLGLEPELIAKFRRHIHEPYGMVLITGPTGSGKTTTLYAALNELNTGAEKIVTIEDPVEYQLKGVVQVPVNEKKNLTFARGLRSILRHDPDKIMIGEIRDTETAQISVQAALTGHLVFTTVHANNAVDVIGRFSHMGVDVHGFVSALNCVMAQRLVRRVCTACRRSVKYDRAYLERCGLDPLLHADRAWVEGAGCDQCFGTGFRGRAAVAEFLDLSSRVRDLIAERRSVTELKAAAIEDGMVTLRQSALGKAFAGETTLQEVNRVTFVD